MRKISILFIIGVALSIIFGLSFPAGAAEPTIYAEPSVVSGAPGNTVTVRIKIDDIPDLYGYQFNVKFNPDFLKVRNVAEGTFLSREGSTWFNGGEINNTSGIIKDIYSVLLSTSQGASGSGTLVIIVFDITSEGSSTVELENAVLSDSNGRPISAKGAVSHTVAPTSLTSSGGDGGGGGGINQSTQEPTAQLGATTRGQQFGEIRGRVLNQRGQVIAGATARINGIIMPTDSNGVFVFTLVHPGVYTVYYDAPGYISQTQELEVSGGAITGAPTVILKSIAKNSSLKISKKSVKNRKTDIKKAGKKLTSEKKRKIRSRRAWWKLWKWWGGRK